MSLNYYFVRSAIDHVMRSNTYMHLSLFVSGNKMSDRQATLKLSVEQLREQLKNPSLRDYLKKNLCVKEIYDNLWSAKVINNSIKSWIKSKEPAKEECNIKLLDHICECGDVRTFENLLEVLRKSSDDFPIHCEVVQKLEREFEVDVSPLITTYVQLKCLFLALLKYYVEKQIL